MVRYRTDAGCLTNLRVLRYRRTVGRRERRSGERRESGGMKVSEGGELPYGPYGAKG